MKIDVPSIPEEGRVFQFNQEEVWVRREILANLSEITHEDSEISGLVQSFRSDQNVTLTGSVKLRANLTCDRCAQNFTQYLEFPLTRHLVPYFGTAQDASKEEEVELNAEDLEFSTYHGDEIDLAVIIVEEVWLGMPSHRLCREDCRGLCPNCGVNLNDTFCDCSKDKRESPFAVLKGMKLRS